MHAVTVTDNKKQIIAAALDPCFSKTEILDTRGKVCVQNKVQALAQQSMDGSITVKSQNTTENEELSWRACLRALQVNLIQLLIHCLDVTQQ